MKNPSSGDESPFTSSSHDPKLAGAQTNNPPATNRPMPFKTEVSGADVPDSTRDITAANAQNANAQNANAQNAPVVVSSYTPSGKVGSNALPLLALATLIGSVLTGIVYFYVAPHFNFLIATQFFLALILGGALYIAAKAAHVRRPNYTTPFALVGTLLVFGLYHGANVWREREEALDFLAPSLAKTSGKSLAATRAQMGQQLTYADVTQLYWKDNYKNGITLTSSHAGSSSASSASSGFRLTGPWYVALSLGEVGLTMLMAVVIASSAAAARFSETQNRWYDKKRAYSLASGQIFPVLRALQDEQWAPARDLAMTKPARAKKASKTEEVGTVSISTVTGEEGGYIELSVTQNNQTRLLFERHVDTATLRELGAKV